MIYTARQQVYCMKAETRVIIVIKISTLSMSKILQSSSYKYWLKLCKFKYEFDCLSPQT